LVQLPADEVGRTDCYFFARILELGQDRRSQIVADVLRVMRIRGREIDVESRNPAALSRLFLSAGIADLAQVGQDWFDRQICSHLFDHIVQTLSTAKESLSFFNDRLQPVPP